VSGGPVEFLRSAGLAGAEENPRAEPLAGGVSSDIWRVDLASGPVCVKRALPRLRVAQVWEAPVERNGYEYEWFRIAAAAAPGAVPAVLAHGEGVFAMEYLDAEHHPVWKQRLREGRADPHFAGQVGRQLATIHAATAGRGDISDRFPTDAIFYAIRLEPYLAATGLKHRDLQPIFASLVKRTASTKACLVHGDVSPKNILVGPRGPVFLDAECAWYGDPAFDLAFCLNHLLLKCLWTPFAIAAFLECFHALSSEYLACVTWEDADTLELRAASLLPGLLLARVDGKSPVEYVTDEAQKQTVRNVGRNLLLNPPSKLSSIGDAWHESLK
jgi:aminoglycoside phosphotransferase (APT) family kinase protein